MSGNDRRQFLSHIGSGMLVGCLGASLANDLGIRSVYADQDDDRLTFGELEPLVALMQETPLDRLQKTLIGELQRGTSLSTLVSAGSLANARTFGGHDYVGFHTFMALTPALEMASDLPTERSPLPVLKVLYRNTERIQQFGGSDREVLKRIDAQKHGVAPATGSVLQSATRTADFSRAEKMMGTLAEQPAETIFNTVQHPVQDAANVHRVVLAWRAWQAVNLVGEEHACSLLRQSVQFCLKDSEDRIRRGRPEPELWTLVPNLLDQYGLIGKSAGKKLGDDDWIDELAWTFFQSDRSQAADAAAHALANGYAPDQVGEAMSIAANLLLLHDPGRQKDGDGDKIKGSVHGASVGVHASDAANAWRNLASACNHRNAMASLIVGAYHTAGQSPHVTRERWPLKMDDVESINDEAALLRLTKAAIRDRDQALAGAAVARYEQLSGPHRPLLDLLLRFATSEDGALHAEKYYRTATEEFAKTRASMRWRQLIGLARVSASEFGTPAPGYHEACEMLNVPA